MVRDRYIIESLTNKVWYACGTGVSLTCYLLRTIGSNHLRARIAGCSMDDALPPAAVAPAAIRSLRRDALAPVATGGCGAHGATAVAHADAATSQPLQAQQAQQHVLVRPVASR